MWYRQYEFQYPRHTFTLASIHSVSAIQIGVKVVTESHLVKWMSLSKKAAF